MVSGNVFFWIWNPEHGLRNQESQEQLESGIQVRMTNNSESCIWNPEFTAWNPNFKLSWITLHGVKERESNT